MNAYFDNSGIKYLNGVDGCVFMCTRESGIGREIKADIHTETLKQGHRGRFSPVSEEGHLRMVKIELRSSSSSGRPFCNR